MNFKITWLLALIRIWPVTGASGLLNGFSILRFAKASSPNIDLAYIFAAINPHWPDKAFSGVRHFMLVLFKRCRKYSCKSVRFVLTETYKLQTRFTNYVRKYYTILEYHTLTKGNFNSILIPKLNWKLYWSDDFLKMKINYISVIEQKKDKYVMDVL